ncbi:Rmf/CrpP family protein [Kibdelosporangium lantanae]|uniref:Rmf/CrpP family protein n=1 Tax=Kibdelosporangium lantanae TaxID=1497396 RepID=A0ABW3MCJ9_9PSEU
MTETPRQSPTPSPESRVTAADLLGPQEVLETQEAGRQACLAGRPFTACPWAHPRTPKDRARQRMWIAGYARGRTELRQARHQPQPR